MIYIAHRINTKKELEEIPNKYGVEIDLRDYKDNLILQHDPFIDGENFEDYLKKYRHKFIILNIKSERIEFRVLELLKKFKIEEYFFLDSSFPMIMNLIRNQERKIAVRFSEFEPWESSIILQGKVHYVWVDSFKELTLTKKLELSFHNYGFQLCLVSPELQGRELDIQNYIQTLKSNKIQLDMICTKLKNINIWKEFEN